MAGAFAVYGGHGTTQSPVIVYEIESGKRLGWQHPRHRRDAFFAAAMFTQTFDGVMLPPEIPRPRRVQSCGLNACRRESTGLRISDLELI
ncbi:hypothetical protein [Mesorhizobium sp. M0195]|uniref:hypothetical protein n=1 Tax=Mesorhizobium sp. M0195 TaxID=2956910 RepID=UPI003337518F